MSGTVYIVGGLDGTGRCLVPFIVPKRPPASPRACGVLEVACASLRGRGRLSIGFLHSLTSDRTCAGGSEDELARR